MTTQDNNEAASALYTAIVNLQVKIKKDVFASWPGSEQHAYRQGHKDARRAAAELVSASASQSSTAGAAKGGPDEAKPDCGACPGDGSTCESACRLADESPDLAHVARQESAPAHETIIREGSSLVCTACGTTTAPDTGAVAEGVDTALPEPDHSLDCGMQPFFRLDQMTTYGAQQREAGRQDGREARDVAVGIANGFVEHWKERAEKAEAALARQPASEGLLALMGDFRDAIEIAHHRAVHAGDTQRKKRWADVRQRLNAAVAAVPPAKAEGLTDSARLDFMASENCRVEVVAGPDAPRYRVHWPDEGEWITECDRTPREAIDRAILAQQAKKGGAA